MIYIVGRSGVGKDTLGKTLEELKGLKPVVSYTNRPRRVGEDDSYHHFLEGSLMIYNMDHQTKARLMDPLTRETKQTFDQVVASTMIGPYTYFATQADLDQADYYIIDPIGLFDLLVNKLKNGADIKDDKIIWVWADGADVIEHIKDREEDPEIALKTYHARCHSEDSQFLKLEALLNGLDRVYEILKNTHWIKNDYNSFAENEEFWRVFG